MHATVAKFIISSISIESLSPTYVESKPVECTQWNENLGKFVLIFLLPKPDR